MRHAHRRGGRLARATAAIAAAAATALAAAPAYADSESGYFDVSIRDAITIGGAGAPGKAVPIMVHNSGTTGVSVTFNFTELVSFANVVVDSDYCTSSGDEATCVFPDAGPDEQYEIFLPLVVRPTADAKAGDSGILRWRTEADNDIDRDGFAGISVADGVDLVVTSGGERLSDVKPGDVASVPIAFGNAGNATAPRVRLFVVASPGLHLAEYSNCEYEAGEGPLDYSAAQCDIDQALAPGEGLAGTFDVTPDDSDLSGDVSYFVEPLDDETAGLPLAKGQKLRAGSGRPLTLRSTATNRTMAGVVEIDYVDNYGSAVVLVDLAVDLQAIGATLYGAAGEVVPATIGLTNLGPATIRDHQGEGAVSFLFTVPPGTSVVDVPEDCYAASDTTETPGADAYLCLSDPVFAKGDKVTPTFHLKITEVIEGAEGTVQAVYRDGNPNLRYDKNLSNNTAKVVVNPAGGTGENGDSGGTGGGLPVTGLKVGAIAGGGVALLALGAALFLLSRRRRVVMVADDNDA